MPGRRRGTGGWPGSAMAGEFLGGLVPGDGEVGVFQAGWCHLQAGEVEVVAFRPANQLDDGGGDVGTGDDERVPVGVEVGGEGGGQLGDRRAVGQGVTDGGVPRSGAELLGVVSATMRPPDSTSTRSASWSASSM